MRITMVGPYPEVAGFPIGGVEAAVENLVTGLTQFPNLEIAIVSNSPSAKRRFELREFGSVTYIPQRPGFRGWVTDLHGTLLEEVRSRDADIIHVQGVPSIATRLDHSILTVHGFLERDIWESSTGVSRLLRFPGAYLLEGVPRRRARNVIAISDRVRDQRRPKSSKVWNIPNAIHPSYFLPNWEFEQSDPYAFLQAGTISPIKNNAAVIRSMAAVVAVHENVHLFVAGGGLDSEYGRHCVALVDSLDLEQHVTFLGQQTPVEISNLFRRCGTLIQFSNQENAPMAVAEALATGTSVIGSAIGGIPEMITGLPGCVLVPTRNRSALSSAILARIVADDEPTVSVRRKAALRYSPNEVAKHTLAAYEDILRHSK